MCQMSLKTISITFIGGGVTSMDRSEDINIESVVLVGIATICSHPTQLIQLTKQAT